MSKTTKFELSVLISLMNKHLYLNVSEEDVQKVIAHVYGDIDVNDSEYEIVKNKVIDYIAEKYSRVVEAAVLILPNRNFTESHYNSLINLYRMWHEIEAMKKEPETV